MKKESERQKGQGRKAQPPVRGPRLRTVMWVEQPEDTEASVRRPDTGARHGTTLERDEKFAGNYNYIRKGGEPV